MLRLLSDEDVHDPGLKRPTTSDHWNRSVQKRSGETVTT